MLKSTDSCRMTALLKCTTASLEESDNLYLFVKKGLKTLSENSAFSFPKILFYSPI